MSSVGFASSLDRIEAAYPAMGADIRIRHGFILSDEIDRLIAVNRLMPVLVRCGNGRFTCPVQDLRHWLAIIRKAADASGPGEPETADYVRDVSIAAR